MLKDDYTCFIIAPIGNKYGDSDQQKKYEHFSTVLEYLILPSLRLVGFKPENIIRSDSESGVGKISESIMSHLRQDDLCIADLTGLNPNVMYEYGVRVGMGKPVIPIAAAGTSLPFDVHDMRTVIYNIETISGLMEAQKKLENTVKAGVVDGFSPKSGVGSFTELSERLQNIEKYLVELIKGGGNSTTASFDQSANKVVKELGSVRAAFNYALRNRDVVLGEELMPRLKAELEYDRYIDLVIAQLAALGSRKAGRELKENWAFITQQLPLRQQYEEIGSYISFCNRADLEVEELDFVSEELERLEERVVSSDLPVDEKHDLLGGIYNQTNRLFFGAYETSNRSSTREINKSWLIKAIEALEKAIELKPNEPSYFYNLALCYQKNKQLAESEKAIDRCLEINSGDSDHLRLAYSIYIEAAKFEKAKKIKERLEKEFPYIATML